MAIERRAASTISAASNLTNGSYAYDVPSSGLGVTSYNGASDSTYATLVSNFATTSYYAYLSGFGSRQASSWNSAVLYVTLDYETQGDGGATQWDSSITVSYCTDWNGSTGTFVDILSTSSESAPTGSGVVYPVTLSPSVNPSTVCIRYRVSGHAKTGTVPDVISASKATAYIYNAFIEAVYNSFTSLNPTNQTINIGGNVNITATYEGDQPTVTFPDPQTDPSGGGWIGNQFSTGNWDYTYSGLSNRDVTFYQAASGTTLHTYVSFTSAYLTAISNGPDSMVWGETAYAYPTVYSDPSGHDIYVPPRNYITSVNNASGIYAAYAWSATYGTIASDGTYTAPTSGSSDTIKATMANTSGTIFVTKTVSLYPPTVLTTFDTSYNPGSSSVSIPYGQPFKFRGVYTGSTSGSSTITWPYLDGTATFTLPASGSFYGPGGTTSGSDNFIADWSKSGSSRTYTLVVPNPTGGGNSKWSLVTVTPLVVTIGSLAPTNTSTTANRTVSFSATVSNAYDSSITWTHSGGNGSWNGSIFTPTSGTSSGTQYVITATSNADSSKTTSTYLYSYASPVATSLVASSSSVTWDGSFTLTPNYSNGTATWDAGIPVPVSGGTSQSIASSTFTGTKRYTLTVTNVPGATATTYVDITRQTVSLGAVSPATPTVVVSNTRTFNVPTVTGATNTNVTWSDNSGRPASTAFSSTSTGPGVNTTWTAPSSTGSYTVTATSVADSTKTVSTTVNVIGFTALNGGSVCWIGDTVPLTGAGFSAGVSTVTINGQTATYTYISDTQLNVKIPQMGTYGTVTCVVTVGSTQLSGTGTIYTPTISTISLSPSGSAINENVTKQFSSSVSGVSGATGTNVSWTATGSSGGVTGFNPQITTGANYTTWTPPSITTTPQSYTVTATALGNSYTNTSTSITVHKLPVASSLASSVGSAVTWDGAFTLTPGYQFGSGSIDNGVVCPGSGVATSILTASSPSLWGSTGSGAKTFTLTVTNPLGATAATSVTVTRQTVSLGAIVPASATVKTGNTQAVQVPTVTGATNTNVTWSDDSGRAASVAFSSVTTGPAVNTTWTAPNTPGTYRLTATSAADSTKTVYIDVSVITSSWTFTLNGGSACNIGGTYTLSTIDGNFTSINSVTVNGQVASYVFVNSSQVNVTIPQMASFGTVPVVINIASGMYAGLVASTGVINTPTISAITSSKTKFTEGATGAFSTQVSGLYSTAINWTSAGGSFSPNPTGSGDTTVWTSPTISGASQDYNITATAAGNSYTTTFTSVSVYKAPIATSLIPSIYFGSGAATNPKVGSQIVLTPTFSYGTGTVQSIGSVMNGTATNPISVGVGFDQTYTLTVINPAGTTATIQSDRITAQTVAITSVSSDVAQGIVGSYSPHFTATVTGAVNTAVTFSADKAGSWTDSTFTPTQSSPEGTVYTITATSVADSTKTATTTIRVYSSTIPVSLSAVVVGTTTPVTDVPYDAYVSLLPSFIAGLATLGTSSGASDISANALSGTYYPYSEPIVAEKTFYVRVTSPLGVISDASITVRPRTVIVDAIVPTAPVTVTAGTTQTFSVPSLSGTTDQTIRWSTLEANAGTFSPVTTVPTGNTVWTAPSTAGTYTIVATSTSGATATKLVTVQAAAAVVPLNPDQSEAVVDTVGTLEVGKLIYVGPGGVLTQDYDYVKHNCRWIIAIGRATAKDKFIFAPHLPMDQKIPYSSKNLLASTQAGIPKYDSHRVDFGVEEDTWVIDLTSYWSSVPETAPFYFGSVRVFDESGAELPRDVVYDNLNQITIKLMFASTGYVILS